MSLTQTITEHVMQERFEEFAKDKLDQKRAEAIDFARKTKMNESQTKVHVDRQVNAYREQIRNYLLRENSSNVSEVAINTTIVSISMGAFFGVVGLTGLVGLDYVAPMLDPTIKPMDFNEMTKFVGAIALTGAAFIESLGFICGCVPEYFASRKTKKEYAQRYLQTNAQGGK
ncbi:hypothetical protein HY837_03045 [archaeon]|nr:hypothetical protein [archaeon]